MTRRQKEASSPGRPNSVRSNKRQCLSVKMAAFTGAASWAANLLPAWPESQPAVYPHWLWF